MSSAREQTNPRTRANPRDPSGDVDPLLEQMNRARSELYITEEVGKDTLRELSLQGETLRRARDKAEETRTVSNTVENILRKMRACWR